MVEDANPLDLLQMEIGRVAQIHVQLDHALRQVFVSLATPSPAIYLVNDRSSTESLVQACKTMLANAEVPGEVSQAGISALQAASAANVERNRVVHDMWIPEYEEPDGRSVRWHLSKIARGAFGFKSDGIHDLQSLKAARLQVFRAFSRVSALQWALHGTLPFYRGAGTDVAPLSDWIAMMEDRFVLDEDGGFRIDDHV